MSNDKFSPEQIYGIIQEATADVRPAKGPANGASLIVQCAADVTPEPVEWLWPGRVALGKLALIGGEPGLGKSQVSIAMVAAVTTGGEWPCGEGHAPQGNVVILSAEDGLADTIVPRLMAAGADRDRVQVVSAVKDVNGLRGFNLTADLKQLEQTIAEVRDVRLVVIDPISSYLGPKVDSHVNAAVRSVLEPVSEMAARLGIAIVAITHQPKSTGTAAIHRFTGSIAFVAAARSAYLVISDPEDKNRRLLLPVKNNLAPVGKGLAFRLEQRLVDDPAKGIVASSVVWETEPVTTTADQALKAVDDQGAVSGAGSEAEELLRDMLASGPVAMKDIQAEAREAGLSWATVRRAKDRVGVVAERKSHGFGGKGEWLWRLTDPHKVLIAPQDAHLREMGTLCRNERLVDRPPERHGGLPSCPRLPA
jgi:RecA-family ATPase